MNKPSATKVLGIFAKFWEPGKVKTRLAAGVGDEKAARIYQAFVGHLTQQLGDSDATQVLCFSPPTAHSEFQKAIADDWDLQPQSTGNLGERMQHFFQAEFSRSSTHDSKVVLIGTDSPWLSTKEIDDAFSALDVCDVVLGPTEDGGYFLVGMKRSLPEVFAGIQWSSAKVLSQTIAVLEQLNIEYRLLKTGYDIDDADDLKRFLEQQGDDDSLPEDQLSKKVKSILADVSLGSETTATKKVMPQ